MSINAYFCAKQLALISIIVMQAIRIFFIFMLFLLVIIGLI